MKWRWPDLPRPTCDCYYLHSRTMSETGQFMSSTYYVLVRNRASTCLTNENVLQEARKSKLSNFLALSKVAFNLGDLSLKRLLPQKFLYAIWEGIKASLYFFWLCIKWNSSVTYSHQPQARASFIELRKRGLTSFQTSATPIPKS